MPFETLIESPAADPAVRLARLNGELRQASAQTILRAAIVREWVGDLTYVSSFGAECHTSTATVSPVSDSVMTNVP
jgi:phosphoadenosine phosphosulfate reductase